MMEEVMGKGRSLELYFIDGKPDGMLTAEVFNWTGHVLMIPRTRIADALRRDEAGHTGVYILLGASEDGPLAYIGEAENVGARLKDHVSKKDWWEAAVLITSTANNLHKAHVKYLESGLVKMALASKRLPLENANQPPCPSLSEAATANMEEFLDTLMMVLPAIQVDMFVNKAQPAQQNRESKEHAAPVFELKNDKLGINATAELCDGEMIVKAGSIIRKDWISNKEKTATGFKLRAKLVDTGVLKTKGEHLIFTSDYAFGSPSAAGRIVTGRGTNGRREWKLKGTSTTYAEWEVAQLSHKDSAS